MNAVLLINNEYSNLLKINSLYASSSVIINAESFNLKLTKS
jgi:hypothetical protein